MNGGTTGAIAAFPIVIAGVLSQVLVMAEMASMMPLSGGEYNWVAILSPRKISNFLSYVTGWITVIAWQAACASATWINASLILAVASMNYPDYQFQAWHSVLVFYAIIALGILVNTYLGRIFPSLEAIVLLLHIIGFFAILIVLIVLAPKVPSSAVFGTFINGGGFSSSAQSVLVGAVTLMYGFNGIDGATHMAEEIENAPTVIPQAMITTVLVNGSTGYAMLITFIFCMGSVEDILTSNFSFVFASVLQNITGSIGGTTGLISIVLILGISSTFGLLATASRMLWAFSREDGVPFSRYISKVERRTALPLYSIGITALISLLLALINLGSNTAFNALTGLTVAGFYSSFMIAACIMLWRRIQTSDIAWGPFRLGRFGIPITVISLIYSCVGWLFSFWPPVAAVDGQSFNWSLLVYFGTLLAAMGWWVVRARKTYTGPKMDISNDQWHGEIFVGQK